MSWWTIESYNFEDERLTNRKISLYDYWNGRNREAETDPDFRRCFIRKSNWTPGTHQISNFTLKTMNSICETTVDMYAGKLITKNDTSYIKHSCRDNLTDKQTHTLRCLKNNTDLIVKPADKGGAVVVMKAELYN